jgi:putative transcriptional regulator
LPSRRLRGEVGGDRPRDELAVTITQTDGGSLDTSFAALLGVSVRTLQDWEQGRRKPSAAAVTLYKIAERRPEVLRELAA